MAQLPQVDQTYEHGCIFNDLVRVSWNDLGEGYSGDYDQTDPNDRPLLRFDIDRKTESGWEMVDDASYCTLVDVNTPIGALVRMLHIILAEVDEPLRNGYSIKKICEKLSWIQPEDNAAGQPNPTE